MTQPLLLPTEPNNNSYRYDNDEIDLRELFHTILSHKGTILLVTLIIMLISYGYLYFKPISYEAYGIIEVKTNHSKKVNPDDLLFNSFSVGISNDEIDKAIDLFKTYSINEKALKSISSFRVQYFIDDQYRKKEVINNKAITIVDAKIFNNEYSDKIFVIKNIDNKHFLLQIYDAILYTYYNEPLFEKRYSYSQLIKNKNFSFKVLHNGDRFDKYFIRINGDSRDIYENIIKNRLSVSRIGQKSSLIKVSFRDTIQSRAKEYVNALMKAFINENMIEKSKENKNMLISINKQLQDIKSSLSGAESRIEDYRIKENIIKPKEQSSALINKLSKIDFELTQAQLKYDLVTELYNQIEQSRNIDSISMSLSELGDQKISILFNTLQQAELKESELKIDFKSSFPELKKVRMKIANIKRKIRASVRTLMDTIGSKVAGLKVAKSEIQQELKRLPSQESKLTNFNRKYSVDSKMYNYLLQLKAQKTIAQSAILSDLKIVDKAFIDKDTKSPKEALILIVSLITGLILGIFIAFLKSFFENDIKNIESIEKETNISILGYIPHIKMNSRGLEVLEHKHSSFSESFREIRNNIRAFYGSSSSNVIMVTSTVSGEGKTVVSVNLASIMHLANFRCVVINLDLRKPMLHKHFKVDNRHGVSSYLSGESSLDEIIHKTKYDGLDVIPSGPIKHNPSELLLQQEMYDLITYLRDHYDYIIIDSAPIGLVTDALSLINHVDNTIFVMREGVTKKSYVYNLNRLIKINQIEQISIIINGIKKGIYGYGYGYGGYGYYNDKALTEKV